MVAVGPGFQDRDNRAAVGVSVGRWRIGRDDANFANCVGRGIVGDEVVLRFVQVGAFQRVVVCWARFPLMEAMPLLKVLRSIALFPVKPVGSVSMAPG